MVSFVIIGGHPRRPRVIISSTLSACRGHFLTIEQVSTLANPFGSDDCLCIIVVQDLPEKYADIMAAWGSLPTYLRLDDIAMPSGNTLHDGLVGQDFGPIR